MRVALEPPPGLSDDDTTFASPSAWADGSNVRFAKGRAETIGSWAGVDPGGTNMVGGVCRTIKIWTDNLGEVNAAFGTHASLEVRWNGDIKDITPVGLAVGSVDTLENATSYNEGAYGEGSYGLPASLSFARTWSLDTWGENLLANPRRGTLYRWQNDPNVRAQAVGSAPDEIGAILVTPERQVLALGCNEEVSGLYNPLCIRGSDLENIDSWTTSATNNAFEHILEGSGSIIAGRMVGPYVVVWTNVGLYMGQFVGSPGQAYRFDPVAADCGLIGPNAVQIVGQKAFWIGTDKQFRVWSPGTEPQIVPCPIWHDFADNLDTIQADKIAAAHLSKFEEVWFHYPDARDGDENSRYVALNIAQGTWFRGAMARTSFVDAGVAPFPMATDPAGNLYYHENGSGAPVGWRLRTADTYIDEAEDAAEVQRFIPDFEEQEAAVDLVVRVRKLPRASAVTKGPYSIAAGSGRKDFRASGRIMSVELSGSGRMRLGKPLFEVVKRGGR